MSDVKRCNWTHTGMVEYGEEDLLGQRCWVLASDYDRLEQECERARRTAEYWKAEHVAGNALIEQWERNCELLEKQRDAAEKAADEAIEKLRVKHEFYQDALHSHIRLREQRDAAIKQVEGLREALTEVTATLAWNSFGECRAIHDGPIMPSAQAVEFARAALQANP